MSDDLLIVDEQFRIANYLSCAQLYLKSNVLLNRKLTMNDIKSKLVGHWGSAPGQNFIYAHLNRIITKYDLDMMYISGPGHSGQAIISNAYIEGTYSEYYPEITNDEKGLVKLCKQFSFPGGVSSHVSPETPGSINEGGELGYSLSHAYGAALNNPQLIVACVIGDGEAETGPLAASWNINRLMNPLTDGVVLPILHLNGYKIANPTIFSRFTDEDLKNYFNALGFQPFIFDANDKNMEECHLQMANILDSVVGKIRVIKSLSKTDNSFSFKWPMIIMKTPKGWTGVKSYDGHAIEGSFRSHQIPFTIKNDEDLSILEEWLKSYNVDSLFNSDGSIVNTLVSKMPKGHKRMSDSPIVNLGLKHGLVMPDIDNYQIDVISRGNAYNSDMYCLGAYVKELIKLNTDFMFFGPDEALSNRFNEVFKVTNRRWNMPVLKNDEYVSRSGQVIDSILSEHVCEGMLEGYILTGRFGFLHSYEAFIRIVDSMTSQHAKWLKMCKEISWRKDIPSLNYILSSHCWQQDHNGFTHQDPGFLNHIVTKKPDIVRIYLPFDANTLMCTFEHVIQTNNYINVVIASKHPSLQWLSMDEAKEHCSKGVSILNWASDTDPEVVLVGAGDTPSLEVFAAVDILRDNIPSLKIRVVNVIDLMKLVSNVDHPHGLTNEEYDAIFTKDKPIIFAFHGYPDLIHQLTYKRFNRNLHVHGYIEEGTITTPFDMRVRNKIDRFHLVLDVLKYVKVNVKQKNALISKCNDTLNYHQKYIVENGVDIPEVVNYKWHGRSK